MIDVKMLKNKNGLIKIPELECPTCKKGVLVSAKDKIYFSEISETELRRKYGYTEDIKERFVTLLKCSNPNCMDTIALSGHTRFSLGIIKFETKEEQNDFIQDHINNTGDYPEGQDYQCLLRYLFFDSFNPPINIISIPEGVSVNLRDALIQSFGLYWSYPNSCGNKIRVVIEILLDDLKVKKSYIKNGKRKYYNLHQRIEFYKEKNEELSKHLLAIKLVGNESSHGSKNIPQKEVDDAYKILEYILLQLFVNTSDEVEKISKRIRKKRNK